MLEEADVELRFGIPGSDLLGSKLGMPPEPDDGVPVPEGFGLPKLVKLEFGTLLTGLH